MTKKTPKHILRLRDSLKAAIEKYANAPIEEWDVAVVKKIQPLIKKLDDRGYYVSYTISPDETGRKIAHIGLLRSPKTVFYKK